MKNLLLGLMMIVGVASANAQSLFKFGSWDIYTNTQAGQGGYTAVSDAGTVIKNRLRNGQTSTSFFYKNYIDAGDTRWIFGFSSAPFTYDSSERDANYVSVNVIIDNNQMLVMQGKIINDKGAIDIRSVGDDTLTKLYNQMLNGQILYVQVYSSSSVKSVFKYDISGFREMDDKLDELLAQSNDPFEGAGEDPFQG